MKSKQYLFHLYTTLFTKRDLRMRSLVEIVENSLIDQKLNYTIVEPGVPKLIENRDEWLIDITEMEYLPAICNGNEEFLISVSADSDPNIPEAGGVPRASIGINLPIETRINGTIADMLAACGIVLSAFWAIASPDEQIGISYHQIDHGFMFDGPPLGLPALKPPSKLPSPYTPDCLGWINYWSAETVQLLGFPDPARDAGLLQRSRKDYNGAWIVQLTEDPLDLDIPEHLHILKDAYARFPQIGGRDIGAR